MDERMVVKREHFYKSNLKWTGNLGKGTKNYSGYSRDYDININLKRPIEGSSDPSFLGNPQRYNPEELLVASVSSCHMLWYLHLCCQQHIVVINYEDNALGKMLENNDGSGCFESINLFPEVQVQEEQMIQPAIRIHQIANEMCFIANSLNFEVTHEPKVYL